MMFSARKVRDDDESRPRGLSRSKSEGFTLVEMMVAVVLIGLVLSASFGTLSLAFGTVERARDYTRVAQILQSEMEDLRTLSFASMEAQQTTDGGIVEIDLDAEFTDAFGTKYRAWRWISAHEGRANQKEVMIWVVWQRHDGSWQFRRTSALFTENGLHDYYYRSF